MSRVININSAGKERNRLVKAIVVAVRELAKQNSITNETRDLAAFIILALEGISETIEPTVAAWEKRDYWIKADRFRMEWAWTSSLSIKILDALRSSDWDELAAEIAQIALKLNKITVPIKNHLGKPWMGAWEVLCQRMDTAPSQAPHGWR